MYAFALGLVLLFKPSAGSYSRAISRSARRPRLPTPAFIRLIRPRWKAEPCSTTAVNVYSAGCLSTDGHLLCGAWLGASPYPINGRLRCSLVRLMSVFTHLYISSAFSPLILATNVSMQFIQPILFGRAGDGSDPVRVRAAFRLNYKMLGLATGLTVLGLASG